MQEKNVSDGGVIGSIMLYCKPGTLIWWGTENSQVSMTQSQKRESTRFHQSQGLMILANFGKPKLTIGTIVILHVFDSRISRAHVNILVVVYSLTRIVYIQPKVGYIVICSICTIFNGIGSFEWTSHRNPLRRRT
jgi:uncharacterized Tic20 family protein